MVENDPEIIAEIKEFSNADVNDLTPDLKERDYLNELGVRLEAAMGHDERVKVFHEIEKNLTEATRTVLTHSFAAIRRLL